MTQSVGGSGTLPEMEEALDRRDVRVARELAQVLNRKQELVRELQEQKRQLERQIYEINAAVKAEKWHALGDVLDQEDIESLCEWSPVNLAEILLEVGS